MRSTIATIRTFLPLGSENPYMRMLSRNLADIGVDVKPLVSHLPADWLTANRSHAGAILHLHWPSYSYTASDYQETSNLIDRWGQNLRRAIDMGYRIVWTAHNLHPHDAPHPDLQKRGRQLLLNASSAVIAHTTSAFRSLQEVYGALNVPVTIIPHGNYIASYPQPLAACAARSRLRLPQQAFVYLFFGLIRPYKGLSNLVTAFTDMHSNDSILLIAGRPRTDTDKHLLLEMINQNRSIFVYPMHIPDAAVPVFFGAADVVVLPYAESTTSGVSRLSHSQGKPVVAPKLGPFPEMVPSYTGWLYDPGIPGNLSKVLARCRSEDLVAMGEHCLEFAASFHWREIATATKVVYQNVLASKQ